MEAASPGSARQHGVGPLWRSSPSSSPTSCSARRHWSRQGRARRGALVAVALVERRLQELSGNPEARVADYLKQGPAPAGSWRPCCSRAGCRRRRRATSWTRTSRCSPGATAAAGSSSGLMLQIFLMARTDVPEPRRRPGGHQERRHDEHPHARDGPEYKHSLWPPAETRALWIAKLLFKSKDKLRFSNCLKFVQFRCPYTSMKYPQLLSNLRVESKMPQELHTQLSESEKGELKESFHHMLKWAWRYNKNLEEQAAQLHMLTSWSKIVETFPSKPLSPSLGSGLSSSVSPNATRRLWRQRWVLCRRAAGSCWMRAITCRVTHSD